MAGDVFCRILDANGSKEFVDDFEYMEYSYGLNRVGSFLIRLKSSGSYNFAKYVPYEESNDDGNTQGIVYFYKGSVLEFKGFVTKIRYDTSGRMVLTGPGTLGFAAFDNVSNGDRSAESGSVRATAFLSNCGELDAGTLTFTSGDVEAKTYNEMSVLDALHDLVALRKGDEYFLTFDGTVGNNDDFEVRTRAGSSNSIGTFVVGNDVGRINREYDNTEIINSCTVRGRYDGENDTYFTGSYTDGDDADSDGSSVTKYGTRKPPRPIVDKGCRSDSECDAKAKNIVLNWKEPREYITLLDFTDVDYVFEDPDTSPRTKGCFSLGDKLVVSDVRSNLDEASLRIIGFTRSVDSMRNESLSFRTIVEGLKYISGKRVRQGNLFSMRDGANLGGAGSAASHGHADGTLGADSHLHDDGTYIGQSHDHSADGSLGAVNHPHDTTSKTVTSSAYSSDATKIVNFQSSFGDYHLFDTSYVGVIINFSSGDVDYDSNYATYSAVIYNDTGSNISSQTCRFSDGTNSVDVSFSVDNGEEVLVVIDASGPNPFSSGYLQVGTNASGSPKVSAIIEGKNTHNHDVPFTSNGAADNSADVSGATSQDTSGVGGDSGSNTAGVSGDTDSTSPSVSNTGFYAKGSGD